MSDHSHDKPAEAHAAADHGHEHHDLWGHAKFYVFIGLVLVVCTGLTVGLSYWDLGANWKNWTIGMALATFKVGLVMAIFMHLKGEKLTIWRPLWFTFAFVTFLFLLFTFAHSDPIPGTTYPQP